jgi:hypothetical protein
MEPLVIAGKAFQSRLIVGTGKYKDGPETQAAIEASGAEMVTVAVRRVNLDRSKESLLDFIDPQRYFLLPNTAGWDFRLGKDRSDRRPGNAVSRRASHPRSDKDIGKRRLYRFALYL